jgi:hypothetical protein
LNDEAPAVMAGVFYAKEKRREKREKRKKKALRGGAEGTRTKLSSKKSLNH